MDDRERKVQAKIYSSLDYVSLKLRLSSSYKRSLQPKTLLRQTLGKLKEAETI